MSNKIKQPFEHIRYHASIGYNEHLWSIPPELLEKYSEMIVRECMQLCKTAVGNADYNTGRMHCHDNIKEHFNIKD